VTAAPSTSSANRRRGVGRAGVLAWVERRLGLTRTGVGVIAFAVMGLVVGRTIASRSLFLLVYGALGMIGVAYLMGRRSLSVDTVRSELPSRTRVGQSLDVALQVTAKRRVSTIVLEEELSDALGSPRRVAVPVLPSGETIEHHYTFTPTRRGVFQVGPLVAEWSDPFGLTKRRTTLMEPVTLIVHPSTERATDRVASRAWEDPPTRPPESKPWPSGFEFYGMRDYTFGDDPRRIVWSATARTLDLDTGDGRYLVWEAEQGVTDRINIFLDNDAAQHSTDDPSLTFETCVRAAASVGEYHLVTGFSVSLSTNEGEAAKNLRGRRSRIPLLDELSAANLGKERLLTAVERLFAAPSRGTHNVVVTPFLDQKTASRLRLLMNRGTSFVIVLLITDDTDPLVIHRAGTIGCPVVEIRPERPFGKAFEQMIGAGRS
jgi:uncharacterized protein (DUF58 family)